MIGMDDVEHLQQMLAQKVWELATGRRAPEEVRELVQAAEERGADLSVSGPPPERAAQVMLSMWMADHLSLLPAIGAPTPDAEAIEEAEGIGDLMGLLDLG